MSQAQNAGFRRLRGFGWSVALPVAAITGMVGWLIVNASVGAVAGANASIIGLIILSYGYSLGGIWGAYWMIPTALIGANLALVTYALGGPWPWVLLGSGVFIVLVALVVAINRTAKGRGGVLRLIGNFVVALIPGQYSC